MANTQFVVNATRFDPYKNFKLNLLNIGKEATPAHPENRLALGSLNRLP